MEWQAEQDIKCPGCGKPRDETMTDEDHGPHYVAEAITCRACAERGAQAKADHDDAGGSPLHGVYYVVDEQARLNGRG